MTLLPLNSIRLDPELQPRAAIDRKVLDDYAQLLVDGTTFPPVMVFRTSDYELLLADGFHRWHAHNAINAETIDAEVVDGTRRDALLYSLSANAKHGLQRGALDYRRAYEIAVRNGLVEATDYDAVAALLGCSVSWGERLTKTARDAATAERDAAIIAERSAGKTVRQIAEQTGVARSTVDRVTRVPNPASPQMGQGDPVQPITGTAKEKLDTLFSQAGNNWASALRALRGINEQISVDDLFSDRFHGFDHVFSPELMAAFTWITALHERFYDERDQRRSA